MERQNHAHEAMKKTPEDLVLVEALTEQSKQLAALAQKVTFTTAEPFKTGVANPFNIAA